eukprot:PITA_31747
MFQLQQKLKYLKAQIKTWNKETFGNIFQAQQNLNMEMKELQQQIITEGYKEETLDKEKDIQNRLTTIQRRIHNTISFLQKRGERAEDHTETEQELVNYFQDVLQEPQIDRSRAIEKITQHIPKVITEDHNQLFLIPVQPEEVDLAMKQLKEGKSLGPDGFSTTFFHSFWDLIREEVWLVIEESRSLHWLLPALNSTFIALIPKEEGATTPEKYRPIALCNVIYKVISKVIKNKLKHLLPLLISRE